MTHDSDSATNNAPATDDLNAKLAEWERLANAATPGPWKTDEHNHDEPYQTIRVGPPNRRVCSLWQDDAPVPDYNREQSANAAFIAAAREAIPALIAMVREQRTVLDGQLGLSLRYHARWKTAEARATAAEADAAAARNRVKDLEGDHEGTAAHVEAFMNRATAAEADAASARKRVQELEAALHGVIACDHHNHSDGQPPRYGMIARADLGRQE